MSALVKRFWADESGLELSEYAVMLALIIVALFLVIGFLATAISGKFSQVASTITNAGS